MTREEYLLLYERYISGIATPEEIASLLNYTDKFDIADFSDDVPIPGQEGIKQRIFGNIEARKTRLRSVRPTRWIAWTVAASLVLGILCETYISRKHADSPIPATVVSRKPGNNIQPGTNKAILILGNGEQIDLYSTGNGRIAQAGKLTIEKVKDGQLVYAPGNAAGQPSSAVAFNTLLIPKGGQYEVTLPDGTLVWLNAASSLKYPTAFTGSERHVEMTGEAYFEVARNTVMPFTVSTGKSTVKVLGTHFNVSAYDDDPADKTALLEGAVVVGKGEKKVLLAPGQQAVVDHDAGAIAVRTINVDDAVAWKNGYFSFRKEDLRTALRKIARWYNVDVEYQGKETNKLLGGTVSRTQTIEEILSYLELTGIAHFTIKERRIIVKEN